MYNFIVVEFEAGGHKNDLRNANAWRATAAELIGTLIFVFVGAGSVVTSGLALQNQTLLDPARILLIALAHGLTIAILVGTLGSISGGHINPVITLAFAITGRLSLVRGAMYFIAQISGGLIGAGLLRAVTAGTDYGHLGAHAVGHIGEGQALVVEILITFILVFTVFGTAIDQQGPGLIASILIGFAIGIAHLLAVPLTGSSMNPARSFAPAVWSGYWHNHWIYWLGPAIGSVAATLIYVHVLKRGVRDATLPGHLEEEATRQTGRVKGDVTGEGGAGNAATDTV